jgi:5-formyltetrahydrofolate cyclo-ligase
VPAPEIEEIIEENKIEIALVPAIAFDLFGNRIGYGYGYYDRFLPKLKKALKIGVVFDFQILDEIKNSKGARIDIIVSDRRIINAKRI